MTKLYDLIGIPFGYLMNWIYDIVGNYGLAIIIFTIVTKIILFPVDYHTQKSSARMQLLNPKLEKLRKSYKDNPTKLQEEQQRLYQQEGINPMGSCAPSLVRLLLLFGVLDVVYKPLTHILRFSKSVKSDALSIASKIITEGGGNGISSSDLRSELRIMEQLNKFPEKFESIGENFRSLVQDFSSSFTIFGANLGKTPSFHPDFHDSESVILFLIPFAAGLAQLLYTVYMQVHQKKANPNMQNMGCMNVMMYSSPVISVIFSFQVPAGVGFYWIWSSVFSFLVTFSLNKYFTPERTEAVNEKEKIKAKKKAEKHPERKTFMQRMLEQQQLLEQQQNGSGAPVKPDGSKASRSEMNRYNRERINEARKRMAEKYGDEYIGDDDDNDV